MVTAVLKTSSSVNDRVRGVQTYSVQFKRSLRAAARFYRVFYRQCQACDALIIIVISGMSIVGPIMETRQPLLLLFGLVHGGGGVEGVMS